jgi:hypothetical protein
MLSLRASLAVGSLALLSGCASANFAPRIDAIGEYRDTTAASERADSMSSSEAEDVRVLVGTLPEGMRVEHDQLAVDSSRYEVVGRVSADFKAFGLTWLGWWFYDYPEGQGWRNAYCGVQVPLTWVTLSLWTFVPLHYPCAVVEGSSTSAVGDRRARIIKTLQKATKAAGGDLLVVTGLGDLHLVAAGSGELISSVPMMHGSGFALRTKH